MIDEIVPEALDGERLDRVVAMLDGCSRAVAATLVAQGGVEIDGTPVTQRSMRVTTGMHIRFPESVPHDDSIEPDAGVEFRVVWSDDDVIVIDKPAGLVVHPGAGRPDHTLVNGLVARYPEIAAVGERGRPGIVHRLDAETSGLLAVARTERAHAELVTMLAEHRIERVYLAVVAGVVADDRGVVDAPIGRSTQRRTRMAVVADGRDARTHYEVLRRSHDHESSLLRCRLETGRTHQIRVHLSAIGHPVLGDPTYGTRSTNAAFDRVALHAERLAFEHPASGEPLRFDAPVPEDLRALISSRFGPTELE